MSVQGQWEEQLIAEWKSLQGYFVETNIGLTTSEKGGLNEADIVAVRVDGKTLIVEHIEVGNLGKGFQKNLDMVLRKFSDERIRSVKDYVTLRINIAGAFEWDYRCIYVYTWGSRIEELKSATKKRIEFLYLSDLIHNDIPQSMSEWKEKRIDSGIVKTKNPSYIVLPRKYRLLTLLHNASTKRVV
jgi:hypothetical protein